MKTYSNCISCNIGLEPIEHYTPCYDDGGGLDSFDVSLSYPSNPYCEGCYDHIPEECKQWEFIDSYIIEEEDDDLPF